MLLAAVTSISAQQKDFPKLSGPYLGQKPPGSTPVVFAPGAIAGSGSESQILVNLEGNEIYYLVVTSQGGQGKGTIHFTKLENGFWTKPSIALFSGKYCDGYAAMHPNGKRMYFQSNRPIDPAESKFEWNIWVVDRMGGKWGEPKSIGRPINGLKDTGGPSVTSDGTMYFTLFDLGKDYSSTLYRSRLVDGKYGEPERLPDSINQGRHQFDSYIAPDESYLLFLVYVNTKSNTDPDLFVSFRDEKDNWSKAVHLGPTVNSNKIEGSATITTDGKYIFYSKEINGMDPYWFSRSLIDSMKPKK